MNLIQPNMPASQPSTYGENDGFPEWLNERALLIRNKMVLEIDDTAAFQDAINESVVNGYTTILLTRNITISNTVSTPQDFKQPLIMGRGYKNTKILYPNIPNGKAALKFKGGSGALVGGGIMFVGFEGNANSLGVELADCCGVDVYKCQFGLNKVGVLFHNESAGGFTEYCRAVESDFLDSCTTSIEYRKTSGNESFHGSGLKDCTVVQSAAEINPKVLIGSGCLPYNAPLSFQVWVNNSTPIIKHIGQLKSSFYGTITTECFGDGYTTDLVSDTELYLVGNLLSYDNKIRMGKLVLCERVQQNQNGSLSLQRKPFQKVIPIGTGSTNTVTVDNNGVSIVNVMLFAANYEYSYTLLVYRNPGDNNGAVTALSANRTFNTAGYGAPTFSFANGYLVVTNALYPSSGVTGYVTVSEIHGHLLYPLA